MTGKINVPLYLLGLTAAGMCGAKACPSGLALIPIAETVGAGAYSLEYQLDGPLPGRAANTHLINTEFGIGRNIEIGLDYDLSSGADPRAMLNGKIVVAANEKAGTALAIGAYNVGKGLRASSYVVGSKGFSMARGHVGVVGVEGKTCWMLGADTTLAKNLSGMADYTTGSENAFSVAVNCQLTDATSVMIGAYLPNNGDDAMFTIHICFGGSYRKSS